MNPSIAPISARFAFCMPIWWKPFSTMLPSMGTDCNMKPVIAPMSAPIIAKKNIPYMPTITMPIPMIAAVTPVIKPARNLPSINSHPPVFVFISYYIFFIEFPKTDFEQPSFFRCRKPVLRTKRHNQRSALPQHC